MQQNHFHHPLAFRVCAVAVLVCFGISFLGCRKPKEPEQLSQQDEQLTQDKVFMVDPGDTFKAFAYYEKTFKELGLNSENLSGEQIVASEKFSLSLMLEFLGYKDLKPADLEDTPSVELMSRFPDNILASAFFAPKITDVSVPPGEEINVGWRKVIRLKAVPGLNADKSGIASAFFLFNKFQ